MVAVIAGLEEARARESKRPTSVRARKIDKVLAELGSVEAHRPRTPRSRSRTNEEESAPGPVLDSVLADLVSGFSLDIAETQMIPLLIEHAKQTIVELLASGQYQSAQSYENVHQALVELILVRKAQDEKRNKMIVLEEQLASFRSALESATNDYQKLIHNHEDSIYRLIQEEDDEFDKLVQRIDRFEKGPLPPNFRKFSAELLNLREKERFLVQSRRYGEAADFKAEADAMEERELIELRRQFVENQETQKSLRRAKHEQKLQCIRAKGSRELTTLKSSMDHELDNRRRAIEILEKRLELLDADLPEGPLPPPKKEKPARLFVTQAGSAISARSKGETPRRRTENATPNMKSNSAARAIRRA
jgi:hypothetical protein